MVCDDIGFGTNAWVFLQVSCIALELVEITRGVTCLKFTLLIVNADIKRASTLDLTQSQDENVKTLGNRH